VREVWIEYGDRNDRVDRQLVFRGDAPYRGFVGTVVNAGRLLLIGADVGMNQRHTIRTVVIDNENADRCAFVVRRSSFLGMASQSGKVRSTMKRGI
jgi:hypothetical protein